MYVSPAPGRTLDGPLTFKQLNSLLTMLQKPDTEVLYSWDCSCTRAKTHPQPLHFPPPAKVTQRNIPLANHPPLCPSSRSLASKHVKARPYLHKLRHSCLSKHLCLRYTAFSPCTTRSYMTHVSGCCTTIMRCAGRVLGLTNHFGGYRWRNDKLKVLHYTTGGGERP